MILCDTIYLEAVSMYLSIDRAKYGHDTLYVKKSFRKDNGRTSSKVVENLGRLEDLAKLHEDPIAWAKAYIDELNAKEREATRSVMLAYLPTRRIEAGLQRVFNGGYLFLQQVYNELGINRICKQIAGKYMFDYDLDCILSRLVYGRMLCPSSKLSTMEYSRTLLEGPNFELHQIYRALEVIAKENDFIQSELYKNSLKLSSRNDRVLYYDCTNYYFEIEEEDDFRRYGVSKENRPNPLVEMGLFLDADGIPLAFSIMPGNTNEQSTLKPLERKIIKDFSKAALVVCTDAGLSSAANRRFNDIRGRAFVTVQSVKKLKSYQRQWALSSEGWRRCGDKSGAVFALNDILADEKLFERYKESVFFKERWVKEDDLLQRFVVTFSIKHMLYQRGLREMQFKRASDLVKTPGRLNRYRQSDPKRFIVERAETGDGREADKRIYTMNEERFLEEARYDGFYAVATNLEDDAESILKISGGRWQIEEAFRIMKSEFRARPVYLSREERITAHFTTCFLALTVYRYLEKRLGNSFSCEAVISQLRDIKFLSVKGEGYIPAYTRTPLTDELHESFGFNTDCQIIPKTSMKKIINLTHCLSHSTNI